MGFIWKIFGEVSVHSLVFTIAHIFSLYRRYRRRWRSRELRRARLRLLPTRQACLNLWYDRCFACLLEWFVHGIWASVSITLHARQLAVCFEVTVIFDERWPDHVVTWKVIRWYCCSMLVLRHPINSDINVDWVTLSFFPFVLPHVLCKEYGLVSC